MALYPDNLACMGARLTSHRPRVPLLLTSVTPQPGLSLVASPYLHKQERQVIVTIVFTYTNRKDYVCICSKTVVDNGSYCIDHEKALHHCFLFFFFCFVCLFVCFVCLFVCLFVCFLQHQVTMCSTRMTEREQSGR